MPTFLVPLNVTVPLVVVDPPPQAAARQSAAAARAAQRTGLPIEGITGCSPPLSVHDSGPRLSAAGRSGPNPNLTCRSCRVRHSEEGQVCGAGQAGRDADPVARQRQAPVLAE